MEVRVLFFGMLKDFAGRDSEHLTLPEDATLEDLLGHYREENPRFKDSLSSVATSVNQEYAPRSTKLANGDEVALLPPVSGGSASAPLNKTGHAAITREEIHTQQVVEDIKRPSDGAVAVFEGVVRNQSRGLRTLYLDYEAYEEMALKQMEALAQQALKDSKIRDVRLVHRLGRLQIAETSVLIVVASEHRAAAFDACRWLIDTLKRTVPIWKKEYFEDGAVWAAGEPFPAEIRGAEGSH
jgi:molybdopterin converting factor subunit 1